MMLIILSSPSFLSDNEVSLLATIASALIGFMYALILNLQKPRKELTYTIVSDTSLISDDMENAIHITFNGNILHEARFIELKLLNSGRNPIKSTDFLRPLTIVFKGGTIVNIEAKRGFMSKAQIKEQIRIEEPDTILLEPFFIEPKEAITLRCILTGKSDVKIIGNISGGNIKPSKPR